MSNYDSPVWTTHEDNKLTILREKGLTFEQIAKRMKGRSSAGCNTRYGRLKRAKTKPSARAKKGKGARPKPWTPAEDQLITELREKGWSFPKISIEHNKRFPKIPRSTPGCWARYEKLKRKKAVTNSAAVLDGLATKEEQPQVQPQERGGLSFPGLIAKVMGTKAMDNTEIVKALKASGETLPLSNNLPGYVCSVLSGQRNPDGSRKFKAVSRGVYQVAPNTVFNSVPPKPRPKKKKDHPHVPKNGAWNMSIDSETGSLKVVLDGDFCTQEIQNKIKKLLGSIVAGQ